MTWNTLPNLSYDVLVTETHLDQIRENIEHLGAMQFAGVALSSLTAVSGARVATGTYTGNGSATQAITGLGFQPKLLFVYRPDANTSFRVWFKTNQMSTSARTITSEYYETDHIVSLDSGGFTVGDGTGSALGTPNQLNANTVTYHYWGIG